MSTQAVAEHAVTALLQGEGFHPTYAANNVWYLMVTSEGQTIPIFLTLQPNEPYFFIAAPIFQSSVHDLALDEMDVATLRRLMRLNSQGLLAKVAYNEFADSTHVLFVTSGCAVEQVTGAKLRRRLEACAELARKVVQAFK